MEKKTVHVGTLMEPSLAEDLERLARQHYNSVSHEVRIAVRRHIDAQLEKERR
jgi:hypothetical protein